MYHLGCRTLDSPVVEVVVVAVQKRLWQELNQTLFKGVCELSDNSEASRHDAPFPAPKPEGCPKAPVCCWLP